MGIGVRIFLVTDDDTLRRIPLTRFERLLRHTPVECLPEYAGKWVRYVSAIVELVKRKPIEIIQIQYSYLYFDSEGKIDEREQEKEARLAVEALPPLLNIQSSQKVIDAQHHFAKKRYDDLYRWSPSKTMKQAIFKAVFGKTATDKKLP